MSLALAISSPTRDANDFYATPRSTVEQFLDVETFEGPVWEPACGDGAVARVLQARGLSVVSSDLIERGFGESRIDFLLEQRSLARDLVTNPPYRLATEFVRHALAIVPGKVAMLLKVGFLEGPTRADIHGRLSRVWVIRRRVTFLKGGREFKRSGGKGGIHAHAWFVWDPAHAGAPSLGWLEGEPCK